MLRTAWVLLLPKILANTAAINACMWQISQNITKYLHCDHELHILADLCCEGKGRKCSGQNVSKSSQLMGFPPEPAYPFPSLHGWCSWGASSVAAASCIAWHWSAQDLLSKSMVSRVNFPLEHQHLGLSRTIFPFRKFKNPKKTGQLHWTKINKINSWLLHLPLPHLLQTMSPLPLHVPAGHWPQMVVPLRKFSTSDGAGWGPQDSVQLRYKWLN